MPHRRTERTYMVFQALDNYADSVEKSHLRLAQFHFPNQSHQLVQNIGSVWYESLDLEIPIICDILELSACCNPDDVVIQRIFLVEKVVKDLIDERPTFI